MVDLYLVTEPWDEDNIDGNNDPDIEFSPFTDFDITFSDEGHFVLIDVTLEVQAWLDGTADNYGFALLANPGADVEVAFDSKENSQSSHQSELELVLGVAEGGVDSSDIADGSITSDDIEDESITSEDIADGSVGTDDIEDGSVGSDDIADGTITSDDIADNSVSGDDILDGSIGASDVDEDLVQLRVNGTCAEGSAIRIIDNMGEVTCETDDDSGDITSVQPSGGGGLNGGADSGDVVLGIAAGGVTGTMIALETVSSGNIDSSMQRRVEGACPPGSSIREILIDGNVTCQSDGDSGGDITSVWPADGSLTGGAASGDAVLGVAPGGINSSMIANGAILAEDVNSADIQLRVDAACPAGWAIRAISADGTATCEQDDFAADTTLDPDLFWKVGGNAGTNPIPGGANFLGTTDITALVLGVNGRQAMRFEYVGGGNSVNVLGGYDGNKIVNSAGATVGGGGWVDLPNKVEASHGTISGGLDNGVFGVQGTIGGGRGNFVPGTNATIGGGISNTAIGAASTVSGGEKNHTFRGFSVIGGGIRNEICNEDNFPLEDFPLSVGSKSVIAGGDNNRSCASRSFIGGGFANTATGALSMIIGGAWNRAMGTHSIAAGWFSDAEQESSVALGHFAKSLHEGAFVWSDASTIVDFESQRDNQFRIQAVGGARFDLGDDNGTAPGGNQWVDLRTQHINTHGDDADAVLKYRLIDTSTGAFLSLGGGWVNASDRNRKSDFSDVDVMTVLEQVASISIQSWRYKVEDSRIRHIGPMAQDFHSVFGLGADPKGIMTVDADGVALAAIQALYQMTNELERRTVELEAQNKRIESLEAAFEELKSQLAPFASERRLTSLTD
jgi:hypothetical protein